MTQRSDGKFKWYYGLGAPDAADMYFGARSSRAAILALAQVELAGAGFTIVEADKLVPRTDIFRASDVIESFEEQNEECWSEDGAEICPTRDQEKDLEAALAACFKRWMAKSGLRVRVHGFGIMRNSEYFPSPDDVEDDGAVQ